MTNVEWLDGIKDDEQDTVVYSLDSIKAKYEVREICPNAWLVLKWDTDHLWLNFALLAFHSSDGDDKNILTDCVFYGEGPVGSLKEYRHTYWGNNGYIFYPNQRIITEGLKALSEFYDLT